MLVLTRKEGEGIRIGAHRVIVTRIGQKSVEIGIEAAREVLILRDELMPFEQSEPEKEVA